MLGQVSSCERLLVRDSYNAIMAENIKRKLVYLKFESIISLKF